MTLHAILSLGTCAPPSTYCLYVCSTWCAEHARMRSRVRACVHVCMDVCQMHLFILYIFNEESKTFFRALTAPCSQT
jgi:hypothetical protein